jgi:hypothetical protein
MDFRGSILDEALNIGAENMGVEASSRFSAGFNINLSTCGMLYIRKINKLVLGEDLPR